MKKQWMLFEGDSGGAGAGGGDNGGGDAGQNNPPPADNTPGPVPYERFKQINEQANSYKAELEKLRAADEARQKKAAEEQGKWKELYEQQQAALEQERAARLKLQVASAKGIPAALVDRLMGSTAEELEADAEKLMAHLKPANGPGLPPAGRGDGQKPLDLSKMSAEEIRKNSDKLWAQSVQG